MVQVLGQDCNNGIDNATVKREYGSVKGLLFIVVYRTAIAWLAAFGVYQIGKIIFFP